MSCRHAIVLAVPLTILGGVFTACSSDDSGPAAAVSVLPVADGSSAPVPEDDASSETRDAGRDGYVDPQVVAAIAKYDGDYAAAVCARLTACCTAKADYDAFFSRFLPDEKGNSQPPYTLKTVPTAAACATALAAQLNLVHGQWAKSITDGRMKYDPARGQKCIGDLKSATCGPVLAKALFPIAKGDGCLDARDNEVFTKFLAPGAACADIKDTTFFGECDPALGFCNGAACEAWRKPGETCSVTPRQFCAPGNYCTSVGGGTCPPLPALAGLGEDCLTAATSYRECLPTLVCRLSFQGGDDKCHPKAATGEACGSDEDCAEFYPFSCEQKKCGGTSFCGGL